MPTFVETAPGVGVRLTHVQHDGQVALPAEREQAAKQRQLSILGREVIMIVEADLAQGHDLGVREQRSEGSLVVSRDARGVVRMQAHSGVDEGVRLGESHRFASAQGAPRGADGNTMREPGLPGTGKKRRRAHRRRWRARGDSGHRGT